MIMNPATLILPCLNVLYSVNTETGWDHTLFEVIIRKGRVRLKKRTKDFRPEQLGRKKKKEPLVAVISGRGVIKKTYPSGSAAAGITGNKKDFLSASEESGDCTEVTFMRREPYDSLIRELCSHTSGLVGVRLDPDGLPFDEVIAAGNDFFKGSLSAGELLKASPESNKLASLMASRIMLPVIGAAFLIVAVNFFIQRDLQEKTAQQQFVLNRMERTRASETKQRGGKELLGGLLMPQAKHPYAVIADKIADRVPEGVMLTELSINPPNGRLQEKKPLSTHPDKVTIRGESGSAAAVTDFTSALQAIELGETTRLLSMARDRNGKYVFEISLDL